ncbi:UDP-glucose--hexose-1-phosphate uridylyltransferase [Virgibacillus sp. MSP4-1]|nr:UDP-glucose--hexose-1-phosphate uridylyltransferase [Virgibacillus sp. MSP4-1]
MSINIYKELERLIQYGLEKGLIEKWDVEFVRNQLLDALDLQNWVRIEVEKEQLQNPVPVLESILDWAAEHGRLSPDTVSERDLLDTRLMGIFVPHPSTVIHTFEKIRSQYGVERATDYFYQLSRDVNYIRTNRVKRNEHWFSRTPYGELEITINLSKPEKDPRDVVRAKEDNANYPACVLCKDNVGYSGRSQHPARQNHRIIPVSLDGEQWYLQYSPYVYYHQHAIVFSEEHRPMKISAATFRRLLAFVEQFPHFFLGSNADLPIVGGSILNHDHYQGGQHEFPMAEAGYEETFRMGNFPEVKAGILHWPMSVIRLQAVSQADLTAAADHILQNWMDYEDPEAGIRKETNGERHNTITPIARRRDDFFELDLVLRNNRTSEAHPLGIFHPHEQVHHMKRENIGLIEVMGLAVLPGRLKDELEKLADYLSGPDALSQIRKDPDTQKHSAWARHLMETYDRSGLENINSMLKQETGKVFQTVLEHAGVFKKNTEGRRAFQRFLQTL